MSPDSTKRRLTRWTRSQDIVHVLVWFWGSNRKTVRSDNSSLKTKVGARRLLLLTTTFGLMFFPIAELRTSLEEHQSALELIMTKYREQVFRLLMASKKDDPAIVSQLKEQHTTVSGTHHHFLHSTWKFLVIVYDISSHIILQEMQAHIDKINEMASVMKAAIEVDEGRLCEDEERIKQLEVKANRHFLLSSAWFKGHLSKISASENSFTSNWTRTGFTSSGKQTIVNGEAFGAASKKTTILNNSWPRF